MSKIEWTEQTWNPVTGCDKISPGCKHCYAEVMAKRLQAMGQANYHDGFKVTLQPHMLAIPLRRRKPTMYFVNSMSDLFHEAVPFDFIAAVFGVMAACPQHTFQVLTKRPERMREFFAWVVAQAHGLMSTFLGHCIGQHVAKWGPISQAWPLPNVWLGVSVENRRHGMPRIDVLREVPAAVRFLSVEPLLEDLGQLDLSGLDWAIVGGESGRILHARPMEPDWVRSIRDQCLAAGVAFFFKQWGESCSPDQLPGCFAVWPPGPPVNYALLRVGKADAGRELDGRTWDEMPR